MLAESPVANRAYAAERAALIFEELAYRAETWCASDVATEARRRAVSAIGGYSTAVVGGESLVASTERRHPLYAALAWINEATRDASSMLPESIVRRVDAQWVQLMSIVDGGYGTDTLAQKARPEMFRELAEAARSLSASVADTGDDWPVVASAADARRVAMDIAIYRQRSFTKGVNQPPLAPFSWNAHDAVRNAIELIDEAEGLLECKQVLDRAGQTTLVPITRRPTRGVSEIAINQEIFDRINAAADSLGIIGDPSLGRDAYAASVALLKGTREHPVAATRAEMERAMKVIGRLRRQAEVALSNPVAFTNAKERASHRYDGHFAL